MKPASQTLFCVQEKTKVKEEGRLVLRTPFRHSRRERQRERQRQQAQRNREGEKTTLVSALWVLGGERKKDRGRERVLLSVLFGTMGFSLLEGEHDR